MKLSEAFSEYIKYEIVGRGCSPKTSRNYNYAAKSFIRYFGNVKIKKLGREEVCNYYADSTSGANPVKKNTAREQIIKLKAVLKFCQRRGAKVKNPDTIIVPKKEKSYAHFIDEAQFEIFLEEISRPHKGYANINRIRNTLICEMLFSTGLRISELCSLNRDSIRDREFTVIGKSKDPRPCFITKEIDKKIGDYLMMRNDDNPALFIANETGERITPRNVQSIFRRVSRATGMSSVTPHTMRHSFATRLVEEGVDIRYIADFLGHQSLDTTKRYTHIRNYQLKQIYDEKIH